MDKLFTAKKEMIINDSVITKRDKKDKLLEAAKRLKKERSSK